ncbi:MAG: cell division protein ZapA [Candidatus Omnitrophica bacterium]|nr:cell division protein ZapA [Candidatus Omnitrophota bacterium]
MKRAEISISVLGEAYNLSGDPARIRRAFGLFQETLEAIEKENRNKDISTHRLGAMVGMALAEQLVISQDRQEKKTDLVNALQNQVKDLIEILEKSVKSKSEVDRE